MLTFLKKGSPPLFLLVAMVVAASQTAWAQSQEHVVYVSVLDRAGAPVTGLSAGDFVVREGGLAREVLRISPATEPAQIALLIDTSQEIEPNVGDLRLALPAFFKEIAGKHELALIGYGERPTVLVDYTRDLARMESGLGSVYPRQGSGTELLDAIVEAAQGLKKRKAERPVIVVFNARGKEFSQRTYSSVLDELRPIPVTLHSFALTKRDAPAPDDREMRELEMTLAEGTKVTGGRREDLLTTMALSDRLRSLAAELNNQYRVVYSRPPMLIPPETLDVSAKRPGLTVRARRIP